MYIVLCDWCQLVAIDGGPIDKRQGIATSRETDTHTHTNVYEETILLDSGCGEANEMVNCKDVPGIKNVC